MFIRSTGLGRTLLTGRVARIAASTVVPSTLEMPDKGAGEPMRLLMEVEITHPVHWTVRAFVEPPDLREMVKIILTNPRLMYNCLKLLLAKGPQQDKSTADMPVAAEETALTPLPVPRPALQTGTAPAPKGPGPIPLRRR